MRLQSGAEKVAPRVGLLIRRFQEQSHGAGEGVPFRLFGGQLLPSLRSDSIIAGALAFVGQLPRRGDPALGLKPIKRGIQRAGFDLQEVLGRSLNVLRNRMTMTLPG